MAKHDIAVAADGTALAEVRQLMREYANQLGLDLTFQGFEQELASLPGEYAPPRGLLLLARAGGATAGCVGLRPFADGAGEIKRLFVRPAHRGSGLAHALMARAINTAEHIGYTSLVLDTLDTMAPAIRLYESLGFHRIPAYYENPLPDAAYFRKTLTHRPAPIGFS